jgi:hypothetical protein
MNRRASPVAAVLALVILAPSSVAALAQADGSSIGVQAPKTAKADKKFEFTVTMGFDDADVPAYGYLAAGVWQHRGDDSCLKGVPMKSSGADKSGWKKIYGYDYYPDEDGADYLIEWATHLKRRSGTYRWCGYVYTIESDGTLFGSTYTPVARDQAKTVVGD